MGAVDEFVASITAALCPDDTLTIDQWAEEHRIIPIGQPEPGRFRNLRTPYMIDIQRTMSVTSDYQEGWLKKGVQLGGSTAGENFIGAAICTAAANVLVVFPSLVDARQWNEDRFVPLRKNAKELRKRIRATNKKGSGNTVLRKRYPGGVLRLVGANKVSSLKSTSYRYIKFEEPDEYVADLGEQGDPIDLAKRRASNFGHKKRIYGDGTPTVASRSRIDANYKRGDQRGWHLCCPDCGHAQVLVWTQFRWLDNEPNTVRYECSACQVLRTEAEWKLPNYERAHEWSEEQCAARGVAHWKGRATGEPGVASWELPSWNAPIGWRPWTSICAEWIAAQGNEEKLKDWLNNQAAEVWNDTVRSEADADAVKKRAEAYPLMWVPRRGLLLVAGVDTQDNRLAVVVRAYGRGEESWVVYHGEIFGSPAFPETWAKLEAVLDAAIKHESGALLKIAAVAIDSGGHHTEDVYAFCRQAQMRGKHWFAIKGATAYHAPPLGQPKTQEFTWRGKPVPGGVVLRFVGTQRIKNLLDGRIREVRTHGPGYFHVSLSLDEEYYTQLRAEGRQWRKDRMGNKALWWMPNAGGKRNEAWDCEVYAYAAFLYAVAGRGGQELVFSQLEQLYGLTPQAEMFANRPTAAPAAPEAAEDDDNENPAPELTLADTEATYPPTQTIINPMQLPAPHNVRRVRGYLRR